MALVDFYQLALLHNLGLCDAGILSDPPRPLPMPATPLRSSTNRPKEDPSLPSLSSQPPSTPPRNKRTHLSASVLTPQSGGAAARQAQEGGTNGFDACNRADYEDYIREDLNSRVFVDFEVFLKTVLHVPEDWKTKWEPAIEAVKADAKFKENHETYCKLCDEHGTLEENFYPSLMGMANAALNVLFRTPFEGIPADKRQYYHVNNPDIFKGGVMNKHGLSPDLIVLHKDRPDDYTQPPHWANPLHILEVKPFDNALCEGRNMPRLVVDGIDPLKNHANPPAERRYKAKKKSNSSGAPTTSSATPMHREVLSRKRAADGSPTTDPQTTKKSKVTESVSQKTSDSDASTQVNQTSSSTAKSELKQQIDPALQVCRYLLEMFSVPLLRSHATVSLVDRDRLQLYHANRSVILVSSAIQFSDGDGKDKFIATIIAFHCLSLEQNGILETLVPRNAAIVSKAEFKSDKKIQVGSEIELRGNEELGKVKVKLGTVISRDPAMVGRSTTVLNATSDNWKGKPLVVKASWPTSCRESETDFVNTATEMAKGEHAWAKNHLPNIRYSEEVAFSSDSTLKSVARLFEKAKIEGGDFVYERRTLRIIIQERLFPLKSLSNVEDLVQVFLDVVCVHHWLYRYAGILHRDLSFNNIMWRIIGGKVHGVLTDYDLSSWAAKMNGDYTKTSQHRTGTPPYMAHELLRGTSPIHLYRHDVESLFYIILLTGARRTIAIPKGRKKPQVMMRESKPLPYPDWFNENRYRNLGIFKQAFFSNQEAIELSKEFEAFRPWLKALRRKFHLGFKLRPESDPDDAGPPPSASGGRDDSGYDNETLGGHITYTTILEPVHDLIAELPGLVIRDPLSAISLP